jgi:demethylmenaquinone methyltransferase/2-methoxy-6-polyprenyl-1,4-benzoquinol methylase
MIEQPRDGILQQQIDYYRARAAEYDCWFRREGRYDRGPAMKARWFNEVELVCQALHEFAPFGDVLDLAAGTGIWTEELARYADAVTAVDASAEVLAINRKRVNGTPVEFIQADLFDWHPLRTFDVAFFGFWLSHVPPERFDPFWSMVRSCLKPGGRVFFVDSLREATSTASDHGLPSRNTIVAARRLDDGREFNVVKVFYEPETLQQRLEAMGWVVDVRSTENYFLYGAGAAADGRGSG